MSATRLAINWVEQGLVPDGVIRAGIRRLCRERLEGIRPPDCEASAEGLSEFIEAMRSAPVALLPELANAQHYEVPEAFFGQVLGSRRKYSCCYWPEGVHDLDRAEAAALAESCARAGMTDGQQVLELGCGWGSLSLWIAEHYPHSRVTAVSNSHSQRQFILAQAVTRGLQNIEVITADMNAFACERRFDLVVSVEMFEHMRNWALLMGRIHDWLQPGGRFFMHIFCHRDTAYLFEDQGADDWMSRHFFSGGMMPSARLPFHFQHQLRLVRHWQWSGRHYQRTADAWLETMDRRREAILPILSETYGEAAELWWQRWRIFFMACAETFGYDGGETWLIGHYLFQRPEERS